MKFLTLFSLQLIMLIGCVDSKNETKDSEILLAYEALLQQFLEIEKFQPHFLVNDDGTPYPVIIADDELRGENREPIIAKFNEPVTFIKKSVADKIELKSYYWVIDFTYLDTSARMQLHDPVRTVLFSASFDLIDSKWVVRSTDVQLE